MYHHDPVPRQRRALTRGASAKDEEERRRTNDAIVLRRTMRPSALAAEKMHASVNRPKSEKSSSRLGRNEPVALEATEASMAMRNAKMLVQTIWSLRARSLMSMRDLRAGEARKRDAQDGRLGSERVARRRVLAKDALLRGRHEAVEEEVPEEEQGADEAVPERVVVGGDGGVTAVRDRRGREEVRCAAARRARQLLRFSARQERERGTHPARMTPPATHSRVKCFFFHTRAPTTRTGTILLVLARLCVVYDTYRSAWYWQDVDRKLNTATEA